MRRSRRNWGTPKRNVSQGGGVSPRFSRGASGDQREPRGEKRQFYFPFFDACLSKGSNNNAGNNYEME